MKHVSTSLVSVFYGALAALLVLAAGVVATMPAAGAAPRDLKWDELIPPATTKQLKPLFKRGPVDLGTIPDDGTAAPDPKTEGAWLSGPAKRSNTPTPVVVTLDGQYVRIGGYVVPLDFDATKVKEFLLVPFVGACIHVPAPPANQIIYVKLSQPVEIKGTFDPVYVIGKITVAGTFTGIAEAGYTIEAERVEPRAK